MSTQKKNEKMDDKEEFNMYRECKKTHQSPFWCVDKTHTFGKPSKPPPPVIPPPIIHKKKKSFIQINKKKVKTNYKPSKLNSRKNDLERKDLGLKVEVKQPLIREYLALEDREMTFGRSNRPSTPMFPLMQNHYLREWFRNRDQEFHEESKKKMEQEKIINPKTMKGIANKNSLMSTFLLPAKDKPITRSKLYKNSKPAIQVFDPHGKLKMLDIKKLSVDLPPEVLELKDLIVT